MAVGPCRCRPARPPLSRGRACAGGQPSAPAQPSGFYHLAFAGHDVHLFCPKFVREKQGRAEHAGTMVTHRWGKSTAQAQCVRLGSPSAWVHGPPGLATDVAREEPDPTEVPLEAEGGAEESDPHWCWALSSARIGTLLPTRVGPPTRGPVTLPSFPAALRGRCSVAGVPPVGALLV